MSTKSQAPATLFRRTMARFFFSLVLHAAGGEVEDEEVAVRGERRGEVCVDGGESGICFLQDAGRRCITGDERVVKSRLSTSGVLDFLGRGCGEVRPRLGVADLVRLG
jgi:hypothetical protein